MKSWAPFFLRWENQLAFLVLLAFLVMAIGAPWIAPPDEGAEPGPFRQIGRVGQRVPMPPNSQSPLGTLTGGIDVFYTLVWGSRTALRMSLIIVLVSASLGTLIGTVSGYAGGTLQIILMRLTDAFVAFPPIAAVVMFSYLLTPYGFFAVPTEVQARMSAWGLDPILLALALFTWMPYARLADTGVSHVKQLTFIHASRSLGAPPWRLILHHMLPNSLAPQIIYAARDIGAVVVLAATFTFIGLGESSEWGMLLVLGRDWIISAGGDPLAYWWTYLPISGALILYSIAWNLLGDGLQEHFSPRGHIRPRRTILDATAWVARRRATPVLLGLLAGILLGLWIGWRVDPVPPSGLPASALRPDLRADYLRATIDSFTANVDVERAYARFRSIGDQAQLDLEAVRRLPRGVNMVSILHFRTMVESLLQGQVQEQVSPTPRSTTSGRAIACAAVPILLIALALLAPRRRVPPMPRLPRDG
jgi:peptide/nickel transport system permease protein